LTWACTSYLRCMILLRLQTEQKDKAVQLAGFSEQRVDQSAAAAAQQAASDALAAQRFVAATPKPLLSQLTMTGAAVNSVPQPAEQLPLRGNVSILAAGQPQLASLGDVQRELLASTLGGPADAQPDPPGRVTIPDAVSEVVGNDNSLSSNSHSEGRLVLSLDTPGAPASLSNSMPGPVVGPQTSQPNAAEEPAVAEQFGDGSGTSAQQTSAVDPNKMVLPSDADDFNASDAMLPEEQHPTELQSSMQDPAEPSTGDLQLPHCIDQASAAVTVKTEPGSSSAHQAIDVKAEPETDTAMEEADHRSAADIFEQTVIDCKTVVSEASSVLLDSTAPGSSGSSTSRIAATERATMWQKELQGLLKRCKVPQLYIGVLGDTGIQCNKRSSCYNIRLHVSAL